MSVRVGGVEVVHWNPRRRRLGGLPLAPRVNNFGDLLGPFIVRELHRRFGLRGKPAVRGTSLVTVGTILYMADNNATIWGTGGRDSVPRERYRFTNLDVRAVRGPMTRDLLFSMGVSAPAVYGDPGLLIPELIPSLRTAAKLTDRVYVPNLADYDDWLTAGVSPLVNPRADVMTVLRSIASSRGVVASSLHALIVADSLRIPSVRVKSGVEKDFKYEDYALGAERPTFAVSSDLLAAHLSMTDPVIGFDPSRLVDSFPRNLWS